LNAKARKPNRGHMEEILKLLKESSPILIILAVFAYFAKVFIEKRLSRNIRPPRWRARSFLKNHPVLNPFFLPLRKIVTSPF
jgi:hypothetical protein